MSACEETPGETLGLPVDQRLEASLAAAVASVMHGARIVRALRTVESILGWRPPTVSARGLD